MHSYAALSLGRNLELSYWYLFTYVSIAQRHAWLTKVADLSGARYERYGRRFWVGETSVAVPSTLAETPAAADPGSAVEVSVVSEHRSDSYARLMGDRRMKADFRDLFLTKIFNVSSRC